MVIGKTISCQIFDNYGFEKFKPGQLRQDLDYLLNKFEKVHPDYFKEIPKDSVYRMYEKLKLNITHPMTRLDFLNLFAPIAFNVVTDGHNYYWPPLEEFNKYIEEGGKLFPIPVLVQKKKLYVNTDKLDIPYKSEIISINNKPASSIIEKLLSHVSNESEKFEEIYASRDFSNNFWYRFGSFDSFEIEYISSTDTTVRHCKIIGKNPQEINNFRIEKPIKNYTFSEIPELKTGVIHYNNCDGLDKFRPFCDSVFSLIKSKDYSYLIIDIRKNVGGTSRLADVLLEYITDKPVTQYNIIETKVSKERKKYHIDVRKKYNNDFKWYNYLYYPIYIRTDNGRKYILTAKNGTFIKQKFEPKKPKENPLKLNGQVYLLTSPYTYSAAAFFAAAFKCYGLGAIIGQETGQPTVFTGDWLGVTLPNTEIYVCISFARFILPCGEDDEHGVRPDYLIDNDVNLYEIGRDIEMDFVRKIINEKIKTGANRLGNR
ncbi:MAG: hypothetical protein JW723_13650 [Bacteroidales bacterium]|nr:hypothetical protein [Bacteroidales bacterium]